MIINGGSRSNWRFFAKHLMKTEENERVSIPEIRGLAAETVLEALREMDALASGTSCKNFFYHANLNPRADEVLTDAQWDQAVDTLEAELGLVGHSRFVVEHAKEGRSHRHVIWSRIDTDRMRAASDSNNFQAHERAARALEAAFGHAAVRGAHGRDGQRPKRRPENWETFRGHGTGFDPQTVSRTVSALWHQADTGQAFAAALAQHGYRLCQGDRRDFCVIDPAGDAHSLARRVDGANAAQIRARLADVDRASLPTVAVARLQVSQPAEPVPEVIREATHELVVHSATKNVSTTPTVAQPSNHGAIDAFARQIHQTMRANGGDLPLGDGLTWIERSATVFSAVRDHVVGWVKGRWQDLIGRLDQARDHGHDNHERDR